MLLFSLLFVASDLERATINTELHHTHRSTVNPCFDERSLLRLHASYDVKAILIIPQLVNPISKTVLPFGAITSVVAKLG